MPSHPPSSSWEFLNKGSRYLLLDNISKGLEPVFVLLCARLYAGGEWGFFKYYESIILLLMRIAVVGLDRGVVWIFTKRGGEAGFFRAFSRAVNFVFLFSIVLALLAAAQWAGWLPAIGKFNRHSGALSWLDVSCYLAALPMQAATLLFLQTFINKQALVPVMILRNVITPMAIFGPAVALAFTPLKANGLALPYLFGSCLALLLAVLWFFRLFQIPWRSWAHSAWIPRDLLRFSLPLAGTDVLMSFAYRLDILLLAKYSGIHTVEIYSLVVWASNTLRGIRQSFDTLLLSVFSHEKAGVFSDMQRQAFNYGSFLVLSIQIPFLPLSYLFGGQLLGLVAPQYATGGRVLVIAVACNLGLTLAAFSGQLVIGMGRTWVTMVSQGVYFATGLGLNLLMVPRWGMSGAAWATGIAGLLTGLVSYTGIALLGKTPLFQARFFQPLALGSLAFLPSVLARILLPLPLALEIGLFAAGTAVFVWVTRRAKKALNKPHPPSN